MVYVDERSVSIMDPPLLVNNCAEVLNTILSQCYVRRLACDKTPDSQHRFHKFVLFLNHGRLSAMEHTLGDIIRD